MKCIVVTPERTEVDCETKFVALPLYDGEYGVAAGHSPTVGRLGNGELRITTPDDRVESYFLEGGFVEVLNNTISILTGRAVRSDHFSLDEAQKAFDAAIALRASGEEAIGEAQKAVETARSRLRYGQKRTKSSQN